MRNPLNNKAKMISADAAQALQKIVANADLKWLFYIMIEGNYVTIVDIDYENGRALEFSDGLKLLREKLKLIGKPLAAYHLTQEETNAYETLIRYYGLNDTSSQQLGD